MQIPDAIEVRKIEIRQQPAYFVTLANFFLILFMSYALFVNIIKAQVSEVATLVTILIFTIANTVVSLLFLTNLFSALSHKTFYVRRDETITIKFD